MAGFGSGKTILFGEHFVVHGEPALVMSLPLQTRVDVVPFVGKFIVDNRPKHPGFVLSKEQLYEGMAQAIAELFGVGSQYSFVLSGDLPVTSGGIGASAAATVGITRALQEVVGTSLSNNKILEIALAGERVIHGNPSGIDTTAAALDGILVFQKSLSLSFDTAHSDRASSLPLILRSEASRRIELERPVERSSETFKYSEASESSSKTSFEMPLMRLLRMSGDKRCNQFQVFQQISNQGEPLPLLLVDSQKTATTKETVADVTLLKEQQPKLWQEIVGAYRDIFDQALDVLKNQDLRELGLLLEQNNKLLSQLNLSCCHVERVRELAQGFGALGSKMTGSCRGGLVLVLGRDRLHAMQMAATFVEQGYFVVDASSSSNASTVVTGVNPAFNQT